MYIEKHNTVYFEQIQAHIAGFPCSLAFSEKKRYNLLKFTVLEE